jgi:hypothetical protein
MYRGDSLLFIHTRSHPGRSTPYTDIVVTGLTVPSNELRAMLAMFMVLLP